MSVPFLQRLPPRVRKDLRWFAGAFLGYTLAGFFLLPPLLKWQLEQRLPGLTQRQATVREVTVNPLTLSLTVRGLALTEPDGRPFVSWDELYVDFQASSLVRWAWTFTEIRLVKPVGEVIVFQDGRLNFANLLPSPTHAPSPASRPPTIPRVNIFRLEITNGFVAFEDRTRRSLFRTEYRPINLSLKDFTTQPNSATPYAFRAESDAGRSVTWAGDFSVQPLQSAGHLEVTAIKLSRYQPYFEDFTSARVTNGLADAQFDYRFAAGPNGLDLVVTNGAAQVAQVQVLDPATGETVAGLRGLDVQQAQFNLRDRAARLGAVKVTEATLLTRLEKNGHLNLLDLIGLPSATTNATLTAAAPGAASPPWTATVDDFAIKETALSFEDLTRRTPFKTELKPIEVRLKNFTTKPDSDAGYSFRMASEAAETFEGAGTVSLNPLRSSGVVKVDAVDVKKYLPYAEDFFRGKIVAGKAQAQALYRLALGTNGLRAGVTNLVVKLTDLEVQLPESAETVTHVAELGVAGVAASLEDRRGRISLLQGRGGSVLLRRDQDGALNLLGLLALSRTNAAANSSPAIDVLLPPAAGQPDKSSALALGGWTFDIDEVQLDNYSIKIEDLVPAQPTTFLVDRLALHLKGASTLSNAAVGVSATFRLNETGTLAAQGTVKLAPLFADLVVAVTNLDLRAAQPYLEPFVALTLASGWLSTTGRVGFQTADPAAPQLTFVGGLQITNFVTTDQVGFKEFVRWDDLTVSGLEAALVPNRFKVDAISLVRPKASLLVGADRRPNLALISKPDRAITKAISAAAAAPAGGTATNSRAGRFAVQLGTLTLDRAALAFRDESVQPHVALGLEEVSGTITGLVSVLNSPAEVNLHGWVDAQSPFSITGRVNPLAATRFVDLTFTNANTQLTPLTGYLEKYGGYPLNKGRVSARLHYHVEGPALTAENKIQVDQLTLGARNTSPDAPSLPLKLGVALLKDSNGRIELDVPVSGRLDDPQFSLAPIVLKIVVNLVVKAASSPFKLLGALVGGGEELSFVEFTPGTTNLVEGELDKLGKLAAALAKRPTLGIELEGAVDPVSDGPALARQKLREQLAAKGLTELAAKGRAPVPVAGFELEPAERDRLLRAAFVEQFGTNIAEIIQTNLASLTATNQTESVALPKPKRSVFPRATSLFRGSGTAPKAEKQLRTADRQALGFATPALMAELLAEKVPVTPEEYRQLMAARARWVQDWLLQNGNIAADRFLLVAPKPVDVACRGARRVNLSVN